MIRHRTVAALVVLTGCWSGTSDAPVESPGVTRSVTTFRQWHGESRLNTRVRLSGGSLRIVAGSRSELYRLTSTYEDESSVPNGAYNKENDRLSVYTRDQGADDDGVTLTLGPYGRGNAGDRPTTSTLALSPAVVTAIELGLKGTTSDVELGGLRISSISLIAIAGETTLRFSQPNATTCTKADINVGLAELSLIGLGNSRCQAFDITGAAGRVTLDFSGTWSANATMQATIIAGSLKLRVPEDVGVRITPKDKILGRLSVRGLVRDGDALVSPNYARAARRLDIESSTKIGEMSLERIAR